MSKPKLSDAARYHILADMGHADLVLFGEQCQAAREGLYMLKATHKRPVHKGEGRIIFEKARHKEALERLSADCGLSLMVIHGIESGWKKPTAKQRLVLADWLGVELIT